MSTATKLIDALVAEATTNGEYDNRERLARAHAALHEQIKKLEKLAYIDSEHQFEDSTFQARALQERDRAVAAENRVKALEADREESRARAHDEPIRYLTAAEIKKLWQLCEQRQYLYWWDMSCMILTLENAAGERDALKLVVDAAELWIRSTKDGAGELAARTAFAEKLKWYWWTRGRMKTL
jgi:hypothetical protein